METPDRIDKLMVGLLLNAERPGIFEEDVPPVFSDGGSPLFFAPGGGRDGVSQTIHDR
jgi:hypothetical protein